MHRHILDRRRRALGVLAAAMLSAPAAVLITMPRSAETGPRAATASPVSAPRPHPSPAQHVRTPDDSGTLAAGLVISAQAASRFRNAPYLDGLIEILAHPVSAALPDLHHFRPADSASNTDSRGDASGRRSASLHLRLLAAILAALAPAVAAAGFTWVRAGAWTLPPHLRRTAAALLVPRFKVSRLRRRLSWTSRTAAALLALVSAASTLALVGAGIKAWRAAPSVAGSVASQAVPSGTVAQSPAPAWTRLLTIERGLTAQEDQLVAQEHEIARIAALIEGSPAAATPLATPGEAELTDRLGALVAAHQKTLGAYQLSLEAEYDLFYSAAESPLTRDQLVASAARAQAPEARDAVDYDLSLVTTQVSQEQAIAEAQGKLAQSFGPAPVEQRRPFLAPEIATVSQTFGPTDFALEPPLTYRGVFYPHFHTGIDLAGPEGSPIHAAADGVVILAASSVDGQGHLVGYGNYVVIAHGNGFVTLYGHLDSVAVHAGEAVRQGQIIGREGSNGWSTGPHLHFEIRHGGSLLDPAPYLAGQLPS